VVSGHKLMLDSDLAALYQGTTGNSNLAVRRNSISDHLKTYFFNGGRAAIVEESLGTGQSTGYESRKSRTDTRSAAAEWPRKLSAR
jgi:hypothetical protein